MPAGGKRPGAGRKPKLDEEKVHHRIHTAIVNVYGSEEAFYNNLAEKSIDSFPHLNKLLEYYLGKPKETIEQTNTNHNIEIPIIHWIDDETPINGNDK